jgi:putative oxidoreductase
MSFVVLIARILYGMIFIGSGVAGHIMQTDATAGYAEMRNVPQHRMLTVVSGILIAAGGIAVILGIWTDLAALGLALYSIVTAFMVHHFWTDEGDMQQLEMTNFMKNLALTGGGLALVVLFATGGEAIGLTITGSVFDLNF